MSLCPQSYWQILWSDRFLHSNLPNQMMMLSALIKLPFINFGQRCRKPTGELLRRHFIFSIAYREIVLWKMPWNLTNISSKFILYLFVCFFLLSLCVFIIESLIKSFDLCRKLSRSRLGESRYFSFQGLLGPEDEKTSDLPSTNLNSFVASYADYVFFREKNVISK